MIKLNIGSHNQRIDGYVNIDGLDLENVDGLGDLSKTPYLISVKENNIEKFGNSIKRQLQYSEPIYFFNNDSIDEILSVEFLEHISFKNTEAILIEWHRILKSEGILNIQVPDCGKAMEYYVNNQICKCVPHKGEPEQMIADKNCFACGGKAIINPTRWLYSFTGAQKHNLDSHQNIFTKDRMENYLLKAGFRNICFTDDKFKLKVNAKK